MMWVQYHPDGMWLLCIRYPHHCKSKMSTAFKDMDSSYTNRETYQEFRVGPTLINYNGNSYTSSRFQAAALTNVWFVSEGFDLLMFSGKYFVSQFEDKFFFLIYFHFCVLSLESNTILCCHVFDVSTTRSTLFKFEFKNFCLSGSQPWFKHFQR